MFFAHTCEIWDNMWHIRILFSWFFPDHISGRMSIFPNLSIQRLYKATMIQKLRNLMYRNFLFSSPPQADYITCKIKEKSGFQRIDHEGLRTDSIKATG